MFSSAYIKGHSHLKCDDYAIHSDKCAFLSDGCSGSPNSDIGAKILPYTALKNINELSSKQEIIDFNEYLKNLSYPIFKSYENNMDLFDCTLGSLFIYRGCLYVSLLGDGIIFIKYSDNSKKYIKVSYKQNYPYYFSYLFSLDKHNAWRNITENYKEIELYIYEDINLENKIIYGKDLELFHTIIFDKKNIDIIAIFSDGPEQVDNMQLKDVLTELTNFKNYNTDFAWRRLKRFEETKRKEGIFCQDDISMIVYKKD